MHLGCALCLEVLFPSKSGWSGLSSEMRKTEAAIYAMVWQIRVLLKSSEMLSLVGSSHMHALEGSRSASLFVVGFQISSMQIIGRMNHCGKEHAGRESKHPSWRIHRLETFAQAWFGTFLLD